MSEAGTDPHWDSEAAYPDAYTGEAAVGFGFSREDAFEEKPQEETAATKPRSMDMEIP